MLRKNQLENLAQDLSQVADQRKKDQEFISFLLEERTAFDWKVSPKENWAGYSREYLVTLTQEIAVFLGISVDNAKILRIVFADHMMSGNKHFLAGTLPEYSGPFNYLKKCGVVINRSIELLDINTQKSETKQPNSQQLEYLICSLQQPIEWIIWVIAEELFHAKLFFMAKTQQQDRGRQKKFEQIITKKRGLSLIDYQEMTVSRNCLRVLAHFIPLGRKPHCLSRLGMKPCPERIFR